MSQIDRRFLLGGIAGVAGAAAVARIAQGGPLNPPAGAVGPTGRTLDEVYNAVNDSAELRTVIMSISSGLLINTPGSYVLGEDFVVGANSNGITIGAADVTIDLNGFTIKNTNVNGNTVGITINNLGQRAIIRNGRVFGFSFGMLSSGTFTLVEDVAVIGSRLVGISSSQTHFTARRCIVQSIGSGTSTTETADSRGIATQADFATIEDCQIAQVITNTTARFAYGIYQNLGANGTHVRGNIVTACVRGIRMNGAPGVVASNNVIAASEVPWPTSGWTNAGGNFPVP